MTFEKKELLKRVHMLLGIANALILAINKDDKILPIAESLYVEIDLLADHIDDFSSCCKQHWLHGGKCDS